MKLSSLLLLFGCLDQQSQAQENHHEDRYVSNDDKLIPEMNAIEIQWDFSDGLQGWAQSTPSEMDADVDVTFAGEMTGRVSGSAPYLDSPPLLLRAEDLHYFVLRMLYQGDVTTGRIELESSSEMGESNTPLRELDTRKIDFQVTPDGMYHVMYVPLFQHVRDTITRIRLRPAIDTWDRNSPYGPATGHAFMIDWIMIAKAPTVNKVEGCLNQYYTHATRDLALSNITAVETQNNGVQSVYSTSFFTSSLYPFATTMNCLQAGGELVTLTGKYFGLADAIVQINGRDCTEVRHVIPESQITCRLPPGTGPAQVSVHNGLFPGLVSQDGYLSYATPAQAPSISVSNFAHHSMDINITPPSPYWAALTITGYQVEWKTPSESQYRESLTLGNVTTTTLTGLKPGTTYDIRVRPLTEDQKTSNAWTQVDLYGRRNAVDGFVLGESVLISGSTRTAPDIEFSSFRAASTLNHYREDVSPSTFGPTGQSGGEGQYGLSFIGHASIQNCNVSSVCCDGYDEENLDSGSDWTCTAMSSSSSEPVLRVDVRENIAESPTSACGPSIRLTSSNPQQTGAVWYPRKMNVREGFDTSFEFEVSNPSLQCALLNDVSTHCRSRGGDGLAFVIQNQDLLAIGHGGMEMGYGGISNSIAIEFDTKYNYEQLDAYENHISVHTRGWRDENSANHSFSLGSTVRLPDLTDGKFSIRIKYSPNFDEDSILSDAFDASPHVSYFLQNADFINGGQADSGTGTGVLSIYVGDHLNPVLITPVNLDSTLRLDHGRAWVGFTAATGFESWQAHDLHSWTFSSLREDPRQYPSPLVNGQGAFQCIDSKVCVHH